MGRKLFFKAELARSGSHPSGVLSSSRRVFVPCGFHEGDGESPAIRDDGDRLICSFQALASFGREGMYAYRLMVGGEVEWWFKVRAKRAASSYVDTYPAVVSFSADWVPAEKDELFDMLSEWLPSGRVSDLGGSGAGFPEDFPRSFQCPWQVGAGSEGGVPEWCDELKSSRQDYCPMHAVAARELSFGVGGMA